MSVRFRDARVNESIRTEIKRRRKACGMSQTKLATTLGITFQQVQKYEKGANRVTAEALYHIAKALETPITAFFPQEGGDE